MKHSEIVRNFVQAYYRAQKQLDDNKVDEARKQYYVLLDLYSKLNKTNADEFQKELAYDQVTKVFNRIKESQTTSKVPMNIIIAGVLIIVLSVVVALNPGIVGLTAFQDEISQPINITFTDTTVTDIILKQKPLSMAVSGEFEGESAKIFIEHKGELVLLYDSEKADSEFNKACVDTCKLEDYEGTTVKLFIEVNKGKLTIKELAYHIERVENKPPEWIGEKRNFNVAGKTVLNLSAMFKDPENDPIVYLSTTADGLDIRVENDKLIIAPKGTITEEKSITVIASDLGKLTKVPITLQFG